MSEDSAVQPASATRTTTQTTTQMPTQTTMLTAALAAGGAHVQRRENLSYGPHAFDVYEPVAAAAPTVVIVFAMPDSVLAPRLGSAMKDTPHLQAWGRWLAASGIRAVVPCSETPATDMPQLWNHLCANARELGIDVARLGVLGWSGHGPLAFSLCCPAEGRSREARAGETAAVAAAPLVAAPLPRALALLYAYSVDRAGSTAVHDTVRSYGMAVPATPHVLADLPLPTQLFIARAGRDAFAHLNVALDALVTDALSANRPLTVINLPTAEHAFDLQPPTPDVLRCLRALLDFLQEALAG